MYLLLAALLLLAPAALHSQEWVAARELARGAVLADSDVVARAARDTLAAPAPKPSGWVTRRIVRAGEVLRAPAIAPPALVQRGQSVSVVLRRAGVELRLRGTAMGAAGLGEPVLVRVDARRRFAGTAVGPGTVQLQD